MAETVSRAQDESYETARDNILRANAHIFNPEDTDLDRRIRVELGMPTASVRACLGVSRVEKSEKPTPPAVDTPVVPKERDLRIREQIAEINSEERRRRLESA